MYADDGRKLRCVVCGQMSHPLLRYFTSFYKSGVKVEGFIIALSSRKVKENGGLFQNRHFLITEIFLSENTLIIKTV